MKPTYLYIKQHSVTGKCYFGKTTRSNPLKYNGSGKHWQCHLKQHGYDIETLWYKLFTDQEELTRVALTFSRQQDIVNSELWLNMIPEDGLQGGSFNHSSETNSKISNTLKGKKHSPERIEKVASSNRGKKHKPYSAETKAKMSASGKVKVFSDTHKANIATANKGQTRTSEQCSNISNSLIGLPKKKATCPHCGIEGGAGIMKRWHFDNCAMVKCLS